MILLILILGLITYMFYMSHIDYRETILKDERRIEELKTERARLEFSASEGEAVPDQSEIRKVLEEFCDDIPHYCLPPTGEPRDHIESYLSKRQKN